MRDCKRVKNKSKTKFKLVKFQGENWVNNMCKIKKKERNDGWKKKLLGKDQAG